MYQPHVKLRTFPFVHSFFSFSPFSFSPSASFVETNSGQAEGKYLRTDTAARGKTKENNEQARKITHFLRSTNTKELCSPLFFRVSSLVASSRTWNTGHTKNRGKERTLSRATTYGRRRGPGCHREELLEPLVGHAFCHVHGDPFLFPFFLRLQLQQH